MEINDIRPEDVMSGARIAYKEDVKLYAENMETSFENRACPGCTGNLAEFFCTHEFFTFQRCPACWTVFMNPGPNRQLVSELYATSKTYEYWGKFVYPKSRESRHLNLTIPRARFLMDSFDYATTFEITGEIRILEAGAGTGDLLKYIANSFPQSSCFALEPNPSMWDSILEANLQLIPLPMEEINATDQKFHVIAAFEVLEHLLTPDKFFQKASEILVPGGLLVFSTPNAASLEVQIMGGKSNTLDIEHISVLSSLAIHNLGTKYGFEVMLIETPGKFDIELMNESLEGILIAQTEFWEQNKVSFQREISRMGFSSHMKAILRKR
jgi:SAM-dependent methyltransferase